MKKGFLRILLAVLGAVIIMVCAVAIVDGACTSVCIFGGLIGLIALGIADYLIKNSMRGNPMATHTDGVPPKRWNP